MDPELASVCGEWWRSAGRWLVPLESLVLSRKKSAISSSSAAYNFHARSRLRCLRPRIHKKIEKFDLRICSTSRGA